MSLTLAEVKEFTDKLNAQHPTSWVKDTAYDAINPANGKPCKIRRATAVGTGKKFLHVYEACTLVIKTPTGEILSKQPSQRHFRINLDTYSIEEL